MSTRLKIARLFMSQPRTRVLIAALIVALLALPLATFAKTTELSATPDVRLRVVLNGALPYPTSRTPIFTSEQVKADIIDGVLSTIKNSYPLYSACQYDTSVAPVTCDPLSAAIIITTQLVEDPQPADPKHPDLIVTMRSFDVLHRQAIATISLKPIDLTTLTPKGTVAPDAALKTIAPTTDQISLLLGTPSITNGNLTVFQGYEPYLQLVPSLVNSNDPTYLTLMSNLLDRRGLPSVPSQYNAGTVSSGTTPLDTICSRGQRYFVYSVTSENFVHPVSFSTRIQTRASGQLFDCTTMTVTPIGLDQHENVLTSTSPLAALIAILSKAFVSKSNSWTGVLQVSALVGAFVDGKPDSTTTRDHVTDRALQGLVDNLCTTIANTPTPPPAPPPPPLTVLIPQPPSAPASSSPAVVKATTTLAAAQKFLLATVQGNDKEEIAKAISGFKKATADLKTAQEQQALKQRALAAPVPTTGVGLVKTTPAVQQPAAQQSAATLVSIDVGNFLSLTPPRFECHDPRQDHANDPHASPSPRWSTQLH